MLPGLGFIFVGVPVFDLRIEEIDERSVVLLVDATGVPLVDEAAWSTAVNGGLGGAFTTGTEAAFGCSRSSLLHLLGCRSVVSGV